MSARAIPVFMYHHVSPAPGLVTVSPETFRQHIAALAESGWRTAGLQELAGFLAGQPLPAKTCVLTFDDGYLDNYAYAHPVLQEYGMKAVLFIVTGWLGDGPARTAPRPSINHRDCKAAIAAGQADEVMIRWSEVEAMQAAGTFEFHSHTHTHQRWDRLCDDPQQRYDALANDLSLSRQMLTARLGTVSPHLCWPQGHFEPVYLACARDAGFTHLYTTENRITVPGSDPTRIGRVVTKERPGRWVVSRARWYASPFFGRLYACLRRQ